MQDFCLSQRLEDDFERFATEHAAPFIVALQEAEGDAKAVEHRHAKIQSQIIKLGGSDAEFQHQCSEALAAANEGSARSFFITALLATTEYSRFYTLMMGVAREALRK
eukprot:21184-Heterococcus_DN1.PRE.1